mgnify:CR=1 FL=1
MKVSALKHRVDVVLCVSAVVMMISSCATVDRPQPQQIAAEVVVEDTQAQLVTETASPDGQQLETDVVTDAEIPATPDRKSTPLNSSHVALSRMPSSA